MTIEEFRVKALEELDKFHAEYLKNNKKKPKDWPLELSDDSEWWSQFNAFLGFLV